MIFFSTKTGILRLQLGNLHNLKLLFKTNILNVKCKMILITPHKTENTEMFLGFQKFPNLYIEYNRLY